MKLAPQVLVLAPVALLLASCSAMAGQPQPGQPTANGPQALPTVSDPDCCYLPGNPAPVGFAVPLGGLHVGLVEAIRPADEIVLNASPANPPPPPGQEYLLVRVSVQCVTAPEVPCDLSTGLQFLAEGPPRTTYDAAPGLSGIPGPFDLSAVAGGSVVEGNLVFLIPIAEQEVSIAFTWPNNIGVSLAIK